MPVCHISALGASTALQLPGEETVAGEGLLAAQVSGAGSVQALPHQAVWSKGLLGHLGPGGLTLQGAYGAGGVMMF